jgi:hypothetical protein
MKEDHGHTHWHNQDDQRSTSQPGILEKNVENDIFSNDQFSELIKKTSEIDQLTAQKIHKDYKYAAVWIGLCIIAGMFLLYFFLFQK